MLSAEAALWNIKGANFIALHDLFDQIQARATVFADDIAERAVELGGVAGGATQTVARATSLAPYPPEIITETEHLKAIADRLGAFAREAIDAADEAGDKATADLFTGVSRQVDKELWLVEAHLQ